MRTTSSRQSQTLSFDSRSMRTSRVQLTTQLRTPSNVKKVQTVHQLASVGFHNAKVCIISPMWAHTKHPKTIHNWLLTLDTFSPSAELSRRGQCHQPGSKENVGQGPTPPQVARQVLGASGPADNHPTRSQKRPLAVALWF